MAAAAVLISGCTKNTAGESEPSSQETVQTSAEAAATEAGTAAPETVPASTEAAEYEFNAPGHKFTRENFPRMDGSTAAVPLGQAIASFLLQEDYDSVQDLCRFSRTTQSFRNLMNGNCDILVVGEPNAAVYEEMDAAGFRYEIEDIATDALIFVVNENNPVDSLTTEQIRDIYSGKITNWKEVGGNDSEIVAFQRNEGAGSQALMKKLIMGSTEMAEAPIEYVIGSMGELMSAVKNYDNSADAIGYSVYYYANDMKMATGLKIIAVDGVDPNEDTIRNRAYPHLNAYYCVIPAEPDRTSALASARADGAKAIMNWLATEDGQKLVASRGYVSIMNVGEGKVTKTRTENLFRIPEGRKQGEMGELIASDHGTLLTYKGGELYENFVDGEAWTAGYMNGFFTEDGTLVTDPVFSDISRVVWWDSTAGTEVYAPMYQYVVSAKEEWNEESGWYETDVRRKFAALDGTVVSEKDYAVINGQSTGVFCMDSYDSDSFEFFDFSGKLVLTEKDIIKANPELAGKEMRLTVLSENGDYFSLDTDEGTYILDGTSYKILAGPYSYADRFVDRRAVVSLFGKDMVIDDSLNVIIPADYANIVRLANGGFAAITEDGATTVFDKDGNILNTFNIGYDGISSAAYGFYEYRYNRESSSSSYMYYDFDGKLLFEDENGVYTSNGLNNKLCCMGTLGADGTFTPDYDGNGVMIVDIVTGKTGYFEGYGFANPFYTIESHADVPYMQMYSVGIHADEDLYMIIDEDMNIVKEGTGGCYAVRDQITDKWYIVCYESWEGNDYSVYDDTMTLYAEHVKDFDSVQNGLIASTSEDCFEAAEPDGTAVFRYSFAAVKND